MPNQLYNYQYRVTKTASQIIFCKLKQTIRSERGSPGRHKERDNRNFRTEFRTEFRRNKKQKVLASTSIDLGSYSTQQHKTNSSSNSIRYLFMIMRPCLELYLHKGHNTDFIYSCLRKKINDENLKCN